VVFKGSSVSYTELVQSDEQTYGAMIQLLQALERAYEVEIDAASLDGLDASLTGASGLFEGQCGEWVKRGAAIVRQEKGRLCEARENGNEEDCLDQLAASYAHLFLGVAELDPIAPFESVYCGAEGVLYTKSYFQVMEHLKEWDYIKPSGFMDAEDHVAIELDFINTLVERARAAFADGDGERAALLLGEISAFKEQHVDMWVPQLCDDIIKDDGGGFYSGVAYATKAVVELLG